MVSFVCFLRLLVVASLSRDGLVGLRLGHSGCVSLTFYVTVNLSPWRVRSFPSALLSWPTGSLLLFRQFLRPYGLVNYSSVRWVTLSLPAALLAVFIVICSSPDVLFCVGFSWRLFIALYICSVSIYFSAVRLLLQEFQDSDFACQLFRISYAYIGVLWWLLGSTFLSFVLLLGLSYSLGVIAAVRQRVFSISVFLFCRIVFRYMRLSFFFSPFGSFVLASVLQMLSFAICLPLSSSSLRFSFPLAVFVSDSFNLWGCNLLRLLVCAFCVIFSFCLPFL